MFRIDKNHDFFKKIKKSFFFHLNQIFLMIFLILCVEGGHLRSSNF